MGSGVDLDGGRVPGWRSVLSTTASAIASTTAGRRVAAVHTACRRGRGRVGPNGRLQPPFNLQWSEFG